MMKTLHTFLILSLLLVALDLRAQQKPNCTDIVYLHGGTVYRGAITGRDAGGNLLVTTWNGVVMTVPEATIKRIVQRCKEKKIHAPRPYDFKEHGWYNATRLGVHIGQTYYGENSTGYALYHSAGWMFNRRLGAGIGAGAEIFTPDGEEAPSYPVFAEIRGYFRAKNVTPFYAIAAGWAFTGKNTGSRFGFIENWDGGWLGKVQLGYRFGNHFAFYGGLSLQRKFRNWQASWGGDWGKDRILHKRLELGLSILL